MHSSSTWHQKASTHEQQAQHHTTTPVQCNHPEYRPTSSGGGCSSMISGCWSKYCVIAQEEGGDKVQEVIKHRTHAFCVQGALTYNTCACVHTCLHTSIHTNTHQNTHPHTQTHLTYCSFPISQKRTVHKAIICFWSKISCCQHTVSQVHPTWKNVIPVLLWRIEKEKIGEWRIVVVIV